MGTALAVRFRGEINYDLKTPAQYTLTPRIATTMDADKETGERASASKSRWRGARWIVLSLLLFFAGLLNWYAGWSGWPYLRFGRSGLRTFAGLVILGIPWFVFILTVMSHPVRQAWTRVILLTILVPTMLATIPIAISELAFWTSDKPIRRVEMDGYRVSLYQLDCGVLCDFAVGVDQERVLVPPLMLSQHLYVFDESIDATVDILGKNELRVETLPYTDEHPNIRVQVFQMKPYFFF
jgi:hypothetical protein